ncbi:uncharacterized protein LOC105354523 [Oryzias latipes]|uniref:RING-type E3 ubiquitin transferase n=1 Tax=Oryzias latipes TaxID=8090 RepID=A0A3B3H891_ORYLA|nr:uncharacterized protein LOC105354523 [Oryzias latipes]
MLAKEDYRSWSICKMAEQGRTIRVKNLPTDIEHNRLKDKLFIHFLRQRNGGGEIDSVVIDRAGSALITFEDSGAAQRIIQRSQHTLEVDEKKYRVTATEHRERLEPDQVILSLTATVDCSLLPGGITALIDLSKSHDVQANFTEVRNCYSLQGSYSAVQSALTQLLGHSGGPESADKNSSDLSAPSGSRSVQTPQMTHAKVSEDKPLKQREKHPNGKTSDGKSGGKDINENSRPDSAALQPPSTSAEESTLIMDADMFQYLHKLCRKEFQDILDRYNIEAVDATSQGLTTLLLKATETKKGGEQDRLRRAKQAISQLYLDNERQICREQLSKRILFGDLQKAMKVLSSKFPKLLLNEDEQNLYIIGSSSDISEAKYYLQVEGGKKWKQAPGFLDPKTPVSPFAVEERSPVIARSAEGSHNKKLKLTLRSSEKEKKGETPKTYKLAARFKDSGIAGLGDRPPDFTTQTNSLTSKQAQIRSSTGYDVPAEIPVISDKEFPRVLSQNTGEDILFKSRKTASPFMVETLSQSKDKIDSTPINSEYQLSPRLSSLSGGFAPSPPGSGHSLRRASSFSGTPQEKSPKSSEDSSKLSVRGRSSSFSGKTEKPKQQVHSEEISEISQVMWLHIKDAYKTRVEDLTSDIQMKQRVSPDNRNLTLILTGADLSKVMLCKQRLQKLVDSVRSDFSLKRVAVSDLGVSDMADENIQACLSEIKNSFKKVSVHILDQCFFLLGPKEMCSQICATLLEVFKRDPGQHHYSYPSLGQSNSLDLHNNPQRIPETQTAKANWTHESLQWKTTYSSDYGRKEFANGSLHLSPVTKEYISREKVSSPSVAEAQDNKRRRSPHGDVSVTSRDACTGSVNGTAPRITEKERTAADTQRNGSRQMHTEMENPLDQHCSSQSNPVGSCPCGEKMVSLARTKCGVIMCQKCLEKYHTRCRVCPETDLTPQNIQGKMKMSKLNMKLPGYNQYGVIKVTYSIPDGFQGESHPSPGKPFRGGTFEAFFPNCDTVQQLLPRLHKAFKKGLTFTVKGKETDAKVDWNCIPHKTSLCEGKAKGGYPDSNYLTHLTETLERYGIA